MASDVHACRPTGDALRLRRGAALSVGLVWSPGRFGPWKNTSADQNQIPVLNLGCRTRATVRVRLDGRTGAWLISVLTREAVSLLWLLCQVNGLASEARKGREATTCIRRVAGRGVVKRSAGIGAAQARSNPPNRRGRARTSAPPVVEDQSITQAATRQRSLA